MAGKNKEQGKGDDHTKEKNNLYCHEFIVIVWRKRGCDMEGNKRGSKTIGDEAV